MVQKLPDGVAVHYRVKIFRLMRAFFKILLDYLFRCKIVYSNFPEYDSAPILHYIFIRWKSQLKRGVLGKIGLPKFLFNMFL
ncbi:hypothetical protein DRW41_08115 [Neobacillus piezotolerans]|uniref:Uncharacterized protein n=1 Tax=Neobacillus piezotolerans TaxID=2259171 RepID=A0A3D8GTR7_9BACI|nr:hypothetical protein DRW41_08115 [Neobacillus piezotolerans]